MISRPVVEVVVSLTKLNDKAAPNPTFPPAAAPSALAVVEPLCVADASTLLTVSKLPVPILAIVALLTIFKATDGLTDIFPAEPVVTDVSLLLSEVAVNVNLPPLVSVTLSCNPASARLVILSSANATPTPTFGGFFGSDATWTALAIVLDLVLFSAIAVTSPPPASTTAPPLIAAMLGFVPTAFSANAPATPTLVAPAPAVASALKSLYPSPPSAWLILASSSMPLAVTVAAPIVASLFADTIFSATPTPMPTVVPVLPTALPSAMAAPSVSLAVASLNFPALLIVRPSASVALALELITFKASPAATDTFP